MIIYGDSLYALPRVCMAFMNCINSSRTGNGSVSLCSLPVVYIHHSSAMSPNDVCFHSTYTSLLFINSELISGRLFIPLSSYNAPENLTSSLMLNTAAQRFLATQMHKIHIFWLNCTIIILLLLCQLQIPAKIFKAHHHVPNTCLFFSLKHKTDNYAAPFHLTRVHTKHKMHHKSIKLLHTWHLILEPQ